MRQMFSEQQIKTLISLIAAVTNGSGEIKVYNSGLQVDTNGDCTVGRDLYIEDELVIDSLSKIVDTDGAPCFPVDEGNYHLHVQRIGGVLKYIWEQDQ